MGFFRMDEIVVAFSFSKTSRFLVNIDVILKTNPLAKEDPDSDYGSIGILVVIPGIAAIIGRHSGRTSALKVET